ncbi:MAG: class I SAM-dependent methyltransferase [Gaiellales bacterium]
MRLATAPVTTWLIGATGAAAGQTILELAAGPGDTSFALADVVGPAGRVLCTDRSPNMVAAAEREARARGLDQVECRVLDAEQIDLPDSSVDAAVCRMALMLMPDPARVLGELRRVCRAGGRLGVVVWGEAARNLWATTLWDVLESRTDLPPAKPGGPGMFALADPGRLTALVQGAGFDVARVEAIEMAWQHPSFERLWDVQTALNGGLTGLVPTLPAEELSELKTAVAGAMAAFRRPDGGYRFPAEALGVLGR